MMKLDKMVMGPFWGAFMSRFNDNEKVAALKAALPQFEAWFVENLAGKKFVGGDQPMYIDMHAIVMMERIVSLDGSVW
jgi:glutathione S-transferase